jgi:hypothetical protein
MKSVFDYRLRNFPFPAKVLCLGFLLAVGLGYLYALANIALVVGLTPKEIAIHYYGSAQEKKVEATPSGEQSLDLGAMDEKSEPEKPKPSFKNLVAEGHFHLFGMTSFFFGLTLMGLFTSLSPNWKAALVGVPYLAIILDNLSFMATRFLGPKFAHLTGAAGSLMGLCFMALWMTILLEIIKSKETTNA